jgi:hypothetical protein
MSANNFAANSRYFALATARFEADDGRQLVYLKRRFIPPAESFALLQEHLVREGDRLDRIAFQYLGDAELFWRICDANGAVRPDELTEEPGRRLRITLPAGIPVITNA